MAKNKKISSTFMRTLIGDENERKIGNYMESTGGGTPLKKGEKLKDHPEAKRVQQPRDEDGKFTYNAVNKKPLKYGPSRGTTIVPFLKGVKIKYAIKKGDKINYNGMIYLAGMDITAEQILTRFREWKEDEGFGVLETGTSKKVGRRSNKEREAIAKGEQGLIQGKFLSELKEGPIKLSLTEMYNGEYGRKPGKNRWSYLEKRLPSGYHEPVNAVMAQDNPTKFIATYRTNINNIKEKVSNLTDNEIVQMMATGGFKSFKDLLQYYYSFNRYEEKENFDFPTDYSQVMKRKN